jgi:hypothetical protein
VTAHVSGLPDGPCRQGRRSTPAAPAPTRSPAALASTTSATFTQTGTVTVTIGNGANEGEAREGDDVRADIENLSGGSGDDTLTGKRRRQPAQRRTPATTG